MKLELGLIGVIFIVCGFCYRCSETLDKMLGVGFYILQLFEVWSLGQHSFGECMYSYSLVVLYICFMMMLIIS